MSKTEAIFISLWARGGEHENPLVRIADWYKSNGWSVAAALCCDDAASSRDATAIFDLPNSERVSCAYDAANRWAIEIELTRLRHGTRGKRENRKVRFGRSSVPCPWIEHAVEIEVSVDAEMWKNDRETRRGYKRIVDELRSMAEAIAPCWALLGEHGRGPSLPELKAPTKGGSFMLSTVFLSDAEFDEPAVERMSVGAHFERWPSGWLLSSSRFLGAPTESSSSFADQVWNCLLGWGARARSMDRSIRRE
jgi:hypothetical protein